MAGCLQCVEPELHTNLRVKLVYNKGLSRHIFQNKIKLIIQSVTIISLPYYGLVARLVLPLAAITPTNRAGVRQRTQSLHYRDREG